MHALLSLVLAFSGQQAAAAAPQPAQSVPAEAQPSDPSQQGGEIVVRAVFGRTTMLFDRGADGKLYNCRVMVSSGSQKRDTDACKATPVCYAGTADEVTDCVPLTLSEQMLASRAPETPEKGSQIFTMPKLVKPAESPKVGVGPLAPAEESRTTQAQRVNNLPPPPKAPSDGPVIRLGSPDDNPGPPPPLRPF